LARRKLTKVCGGDLKKAQWWWWGCVCGRHFTSRVFGEGRVVGCGWVGGVGLMGVTQLKEGEKLAAATVPFQ